MVPPMGASTPTREPLHSIIASRAEERIRSGAWGPGTRLPPERELCEQLDVSRATLRQALAELEARGLISRHQGRGTFVARTRVDAVVDGFFTIGAALRSRGLVLTTTVLAAKVVDAGKAVADDLGVQPGDPVVHLERLRSAGAEPLLLETTDLSSALLPGLESADFAHRSLYDILREDHGRTVETATESLEPVIVTAHEAATLRVPRQTPAMLIRRVSHDQTGAIVELSHLVLRGDRSRFLLERRVRQPWPGAPRTSRHPDDGRRATPAEAIAASLLDA
jgi:GntR family transcriptional regulator